jgi:hypothetical protein
MLSPRILTLCAVLLLAGCGRMGDLKPIPGQEPIKPLMAKRTPTAEELLTVPPYARPDRVDELIRRSRPRQSDPFDLPPPTGSAAPPLPAGSDPQPVTNETGPATPK